VTGISPDEILIWEWSIVRVNATLLWTWVVMAVLVLGSWLATRRLTTGPDPSRSQVVLETVVEAIRQQIGEITSSAVDRYLAFVGTLFLYIGVANLLGIVPGYVPPTASLSTTAALALSVMLAVPAYGIASSGWGEYLRRYIEPTAIMLPFNLIGELSRTLALAVRLFGNVMSSAKIVGVLLAVVPFFLPIVFRALGLLTGLIQAYIFAVLAMVYIAAGVRSQERTGSDTGGTDG
jgi:F-type H+-transporting ATPase subunit a